MFIYSLKLALTNLKNRPDLTFLTVLLIAIGIALLTTMTTMSYQSSKIPLENKSHQLYTLLLDSRDLKARDAETPDRMPWLTYLDVENLLQTNNPNVEKTYIWRSNAFLNLEFADINPRQVRIMAGQSNFFSLFESPFLYGNGWTADDDKNASQVVVLSFKMNQHFFGGKNSVGQTININSTPLTVVGVLAHWNLPSRFYDRSFDTRGLDDVYLPSRLALNINLPRQIGCWEKDRSLQNEFSLKNVEGLKASECRWIVMWAQIKDKNSAENFHNYMNQYVTEQKSLGRFPRSANNQLVSINQYMQSLNARTRFHDVLVIMARLFFIVCLVNTISLLLAKYMGKIPEIALRRALGAKKHVILSQYLLEISFISLIGGLIGIGLSYFGLLGMMALNIYQSDYTVTAEAIKHAYQLDWVMIVQGLSIGVGATLVVSLYPVWKICNTPPATQLKAQ